MYLHSYKNIVSANNYIRSHSLDFIDHAATGVAAFGHSNIHIHIWRLVDDRFESSEETPYTNGTEFS